MTTYYVDTSAGVDGSGTQSNPFNTPDSLSVASNGDTILFKTGTTIDAALMQAPSWLDRANLTIGEYGTGAKPKFYGGVIQTDWTEDAGNGVWFCTLAANTGGNVREDGRPMTYVAFTTNIATTAALMAAGSFSYDWVNFIVYIKPSAGLPAAHEYEVSIVKFGINLTLAAQKAGLVLRNLRTEMISRHGFLLVNRPQFDVRGLEMVQIGGHRNTGASVWVGNGIEFAEGSSIGHIEDMEAQDIFDSALTSQTHAATGVRLVAHTYKDIRAYRCGQSAIEISNQTVLSVQHGHIVEDVYAEDISQPGACWSGYHGYGGAPYVTTCNDGGIIDGCYARSILVKRARYAHITTRTRGANMMEDVYAEDLTSTLSKITTSTDQVDMWRNVIDDQGRTPTGGAYVLNNNYAYISGIPIP